MNDIPSSSQQSQSARHNSQSDELSDSAKSFMNAFDSRSSGSTPQQDHPVPMKIPVIIQASIASQSESHSEAAGPSQPESITKGQLLLELAPKPKPAIDHFRRRSSTMLPHHMQQQIVQEHQETNKSTSMSLKQNALNFYAISPQRYSLRDLYGIFHCHGKEFHFDTKSLWLFDQTMTVRKRAVWLAEWKQFQLFTILCIILNSILMAFEDYGDRVNPDFEPSRMSKFSSKASIGFTILFTIELLIKVVAQGFIVHKSSYMRDWWNVLDFTVVTISLLEFALETRGDFTLMRMLRLLKPLRSVKALKILRFLISSLMRSLAGLLNVFLFLGFVFSIFAILGVNLFSGNQYRACRSTADLVYPSDGSDPYWPKLDLEDPLCYTDADCARISPGSVCGSIYEKAGLDPVKYDQVRDNQQILYGIAGFDHFGQALYTVFQICTLESWVYLMYNFADTSESPFLSYIFFPSIVIFGAFFTMNLILAQILDAFNHQQIVFEQKKREKEENERIKRQHEAHQLDVKSKLSKGVLNLVSQTFETHYKGKRASRRLTKKAGQELAMPPQIEMTPKPKRSSTLPSFSQPMSMLEESKSTNRRTLGRLSSAQDYHIARIGAFQATQGNRISLIQPQLPGLDVINEPCEASESSQNSSSSVAQPSSSATEQLTAKKTPQEVQEIITQVQQPARINNIFGDTVTPKVTVPGVLEETIVFPPEEAKVPQDGTQIVAVSDQEASLQSEVPELVFQDHEDDQMATERAQDQSLTRVLDVSVTPVVVQDLDDLKDPVSSRLRIDNIFENSDDGGSREEAPKTLPRLEINSNIDDQGSGSSKSKSSSAKSNSSQRSDSDSDSGSIELDQNVINHLRQLTKLQQSDGPQLRRKSTMQIVWERNSKYPCYKWALSIVGGSPFNLFMLVLILVNAYTMASYSYKQSESQRSAFAYAEYLFDAIFFLELVLKLLGFGFKVYIKDTWNIFDALIVFLSMLELLLYALFDNLGVIVQVFEFLKLLRLFRILKIARFFKGMRLMLAKTWESLKEICPFSCLLFLFIYLFALVGQELFAYKAMLDEDGDLFYGKANIEAYVAAGRVVRYPRINFNTFGEALTTVFILINGEDWIWIAQVWIRAYGEGEYLAETAARTYFVVLMLFGHLTLFALFTGMLLHNFQQYQKDFSSFEAKQTPSCQQRVKSVFKQFFRALDEQERDKYFEEAHGNADLGQPTIIENEMDELMNSKLEEKDFVNGVGHTTSLRRDLPTLQLFNMSTDLAHYDLNSLRTKKQKFGLKQILQIKVNLEGNALGCFQPDHWLRKACSSVCQHWIFSLLVILLILVTTVCSAFDSPLNDPQSDTTKNLELVNNIITLLFIVEAALKIITLGFWRNGPHSYLQSPWNCLDFIIVVLSIFDFAAQKSDSFQSIQFLRVVRLLRPVRLVAQNSSLKTAITSLVKSVPKICELLSLVVLVVFMLAALQTYLFSGKFYYCYTEHLKMSEVRQTEIVKHKWDCLNYGGEWIKPQLNFDHIGASMLGLSSIQSHEGWLGMMWSSVDATEVDFAPLLNNRWYIFVPFSLLVIFVICLLFLNLFVGVVIETFNDQKEILTNNHVLTSSQRTYLQTQLLTFTVGPKVTYAGESTNQLTNACRRLCFSREFEIFILVCILLNTLALAVKSYTLSENASNVLELINMSFLVIFSLEAVIKIIAQKRAYFKDGWNQFDFGIVALAILFTVPSSMGYFKEYKGFTTAVRVLRVARTLRLVVKASKIQIIFRTLVDAGPALGSLGFLLILQIYIFAVIGVQLFALLDLHTAEGVESELDYHANFQHFFNSFMTLLRCATGENWNQIMFECAKGRDILYQCNEGETYDSIIAGGRDPGDYLGPKGCGSYTSSIMFHLIFQVIITQIFLNLFIAVIVDSFTGVSEAFKLPVSTMAVLEFEEIWSRNFDTSGTGFMKTSDLDALLVAIAESKNASQLLIIPDYVRESSLYRQKIIQQLEIPTFGRFQKVMFYDTIQKMALRVLRLDHIKQQMIERKRLIHVMEKLQMKSGHRILQEFEADSMRTDFHKQFQAMVAKLESMSGQIELIKQLRAKTRRLSKVYNNMVDTDRAIQNKTERKIHNLSNPNLVQIYTTKHYVAGCMIQRAWLQYKDKCDIAFIEEQAIPVNDSDYEISSQEGGSRARSREQSSSSSASGLVFNGYVQQQTSQLRQIMVRSLPES